MNAPFRKLGDICTKPQYGWTTKAIHSGSVKLLRTTDITKEHLNWDTVPFCTDIPARLENYLVESGDILVSRAGSVGASYLVENPEKSVFASYLIRFNPISDIVSPEYVHLYLQTPAFWNFIQDNQSGIAMLNVNASKLSNLPVPVPPLDVQAKIVQSVNNSLMGLNTLHHSLELISIHIARLRQSILKAACEGRLVPTEAELAAQEGRDYETGEQLLTRILEERRHSFTGRGKYKEPTEPDSESVPLELQSGWTWATFDQIADIRLGKMLDKSKHRHGIPLPYLRNINVRWRSVKTDDLLNMFFLSEEIDRYSVCKGDLLVCEGGEPGRAAIWDGEPITFQKALHRVRPKSGVEVQHALNWIQYLAQSGKLASFFSGSTIKHLTREAFIPIPFPLPPLAEQKRIVEEVERRFAILDQVEELIKTNLERCQTLRQSILHKAFSFEDLEDEESK